MTSARLRRARRRAGISARQQRKQLKRQRLGKRFGLPRDKR